MFTNAKFLLLSLVVLVSEISAQCVSREGSASSGSFTVALQTDCDQGTVTVSISKSQFSSTSWFGVVFSTSMLGQSLVYTTGKQAAETLRVWEYSLAGYRANSVQAANSDWTELQTDIGANTITVQYQANITDTDILSENTESVDFMWAIGGGLQLVQHVSQASSSVTIALEPIPTTTTAAPTTTAPTTAAPTTDAPTTDAPTTIEIPTSQPTSAAPTGPMTTDPTTAQQTTTTTTSTTVMPTPMPITTTTSTSEPTTAEPTTATPSSMPTTQPTSAPVARCGRIGATPLDVCLVFAAESLVGARKYYCNELGQYRLAFYDSEDCEGNATRTLPQLCGAEGVGCVCDTGDACDYAVFRTYLDVSPFTLALPGDDSNSTFNFDFDFDFDVDSNNATSQANCSGDVYFERALVLGECIGLDSVLFPFAGAEFGCSFADDGEPQLSTSLCVQPPDLGLNFSLELNITHAPNTSLPTFSLADIDVCDLQCMVGADSNTSTTTTTATMESVSPTLAPTMQPTVGTCVDKVGSVSDEAFEVSFAIDCVRELVQLNLVFTGYAGNWFGIVFARDDSMLGNALIYTTGKRTESVLDEEEPALHPYVLTQWVPSGVNYDAAAEDWTKVAAVFTNDTANITYQQRLQGTTEFDVNTTEIPIRWAYGDTANGLVLMQHPANATAAQTLMVALQDVAEPTGQPTSAPNKKNEQAIIIGSVVGGFFFLLFVALGIWYCHDRYKSKESNATATDQGKYGVVNNDAEEDEDVELATAPTTR